MQHRVMMGQASQLITGSFQGFTSLDLATHAALKPRSFSIARHRAGPSRGQPSRMSLRFFGMLPGYDLRCRYPPSAPSTCSKVYESSMINC